MGNEVAKVVYVVDVNKATFTQWSIKIFFFWVNFVVPILYIHVPLTDITSVLIRYK